MTLQGVCGMVCRPYETLRRRHDLGTLLKFLVSPRATRNDHRGDHGGDDADYDRRSCVFRFITCKGYRC